MPRQEEEQAELEHVVGLSVSQSGTSLLVSYEGEKYWIPQSQIHEDSEVWKKGDEGTLIIPVWLAKDRGMV